MAKWNMATASNITYTGLPTWRLPSEGYAKHFGEDGEWYQVPDEYHLIFGILANGRYRAELWFDHDSPTYGVTAKLYRETGDGAGKLVWSKQYDNPRYGALPYEEMGRAYQEEVIKDV